MRHHISFASVDYFFVTNNTDEHSVFYLQMFLWKRMTRTLEAYPVSVFYVTKQTINQALNAIEALCKIILSISNSYITME